MATDGGIPVPDSDHFNILRFPDLDGALDFGVAFYLAVRDGFAIDRLTDGPRIAILAAPHLGRDQQPVELYLSDGALAIVRAFDLPGTPGEIVAAESLPPGCVSFVGPAGEREETAVA